MYSLFSRALLFVLLTVSIGSCGEQRNAQRTSDTQANETEARGVVIGEIAPMFSNTTLDGTSSFSLEDIHAKQTVITFWASWCLPCAEETKVLKKHYERTSRKDFEVIGIAYDDALSDARRFARDEEIPWIVLHDPDGTTAKTYGVRGIPVAIFLDADLRVTTQVFGLTSDERLQEALQES